MSLLAIVAFFLVDRLFAPVSALMGADTVRGWPIRPACRC
jgi:STE24 endopeptidase